MAARTLLTPEEQTPPSARWSPLTRIGFRFAFCYLLLWCSPATGNVWLLDTIPILKMLSIPWVWLWHHITPWTAIHLFHLQGQRVTYFPTGSGDTTLDYVGAFLYLVFAMIGTLVWSILDRRRPGYRTLLAWLHLVVRLTLAATLLQYGIAKVIPTQFQSPGLIRLAETYGESSPMGILWTFMGASMPYVIFSGLAEVSAGILLIFRRTALLGALVSAGVMLNVTMLNFCYDVPVKLYSSHLFLASVFLLLPDLHRLANVFVLNRTATPSEVPRVSFSRRWMQASAAVFKYAAFAYMIVVVAVSGWQFHTSVVTRAEPSMYGIYEVDAFHSSNSAAPAWQQLIVDGSRWVIRLPDDTEFIDSHFSNGGRSIELSSPSPKLRGDLTASTPDAGHLVLTGKLGNDTLTVHLHRADPSELQLRTRGFHWINEFPFNR